MASIYLFHVTVVWWMLNSIFLIIGFVSFSRLFVEQLENELELLQMHTQEDDESQLNTKIFRIIELHCEAKQLEHVIILVTFHRFG